MSIAPIVADAEAPRDPVTDEGGAIARAEALADYAILDTPAEPAFDDIARLAAALCDAEFAAVTFLEGGRQWLKSSHGFPAELLELPLAGSFCERLMGYVEAGGEPPLVLHDARLDPVLSKHRYVAGRPHIRFYAGMPLRAHEERGGIMIGSFVVMGTRVRGLSAAQAEALRALAGQVAAQLELRRRLRGLERAEAERERAEERYRSFVANASEAIWRIELDRPLPVRLPVEQQMAWFYRHGWIAECNDLYARMFGRERAAEMIGVRWAEVRPPTPENSARLREFIEAHYRVSGARLQTVGPDGRKRSFINNKTGIIADGCLVRVWGTQRDVTREAQADAALRHSEGRFRRMAQSVLGTVYQYVESPDGAARFARFGDGLRDALGVDPSEVTESAAPVISLIHPDDRPDYETAMTSARVTLAPFRWEGRLRHRGTGRYHWFRAASMPERQDDGTIQWDGILSDVTEQREAFEALRLSRERAAWEATHDPLTGLANRAYFLTALETALEKAGSDSSVGVLFLDLDGFKRVNDMLGHATGDALLSAVAERLRGIVPAEVTLARLGGDEFIVLLPEVVRADEPRRVAETILGAFREPFAIGEAAHEFVVTASVGIAQYPYDGDDAHSLMRAADTAMYEAKAQGRNNCQAHTEAMNVAVYDRMLLQNRLARAAEFGELALEYQPQVDLAASVGGATRVIGTEALLRWNHPEIGSVGRDRFIPLAEETGLIRPMGEWVLRRACRDVAAWFRDRGIAAVPPAAVAVNISARQLGHPDFVATVADALAGAGLTGSNLELEITETALIWNGQASLRTLERLKALGIRLSVDDFGTGYSSLSYLRRFPFDAVKIDRSFVAEMTADPQAHAIVRGVVDLSHSLGLRVIAEGVETEAQADVLRALGCDAAQGWLYWPSLPGEQMAALYTDGGNAPD